MADGQENFADEQISELFSYALSKCHPRSKQPPTLNSRLLERNPKSQKKLEHMRTMLKVKEMEQCTFKPAINTNSSAKPRYNQFVRQQEQPVEQVCTSRPSFKPSISQKSTKLCRQNRICDILYEDAIRRKRQKQIAPPEDDNISVVSQKNNKIAGDRLVKEYVKVLETMKLDVKRPLSIHQLHLIMKNMEFVKTEKIFTAQPENTLVYEMFEILTIRGQGGVRVKNLAVFLLAVMGIFQIEDINPEASVLRIKDINEKEQVHSSKFGGLINSDGLLILTKEVGFRLHKYFRLFYLNRLCRSATPNKSPRDRSLNETIKEKKQRTANTNSKKAHNRGATTSRYNWMTADESQDGGNDITGSHLEQSCLEGRSRFMISRQVKTFYTHANDPNESGSMLLQESAVYQMTQPQSKGVGHKAQSEILEPCQPLFVIEVLIQGSLIDLPIYEHQRDSPGSVSDAFAREHNLDSESRSRLYTTLCETLQQYFE